MHPVAGPLLRILKGDEHFPMLALSQRELGLLEGSRERPESTDPAMIEEAAADGRVATLLVTAVFRY